MSRVQKWLGSFFDKTTGPHTRLRAELFTGVDNRLCVYCQNKADYRLYVFTQIKTKSAGGVFREKLFFRSMICFCLGITIPESILDFGLRLWENKNRNRKSRFRFIFIYGMRYLLPYNVLLRRLYSTFSLMLPCQSSLCQYLPMNCSK